jgi:hypothetical protein
VPKHRSAVHREGEVAVHQVRHDVRRAAPRLIVKRHG